MRPWRWNHQAGRWEGGSCPRRLRGAAAPRGSLQPSAKFCWSEPLPRCGEVKMRAFPSLVCFPRTLKPPGDGVGGGGWGAPLPVWCGTSMLGWGCSLGSWPPRPAWTFCLRVESCSCPGHREQHRNHLKPDLLFSGALHQFLSFCVFLLPYTLSLELE